MEDYLAGVALEEMAHSSAMSWQVEQRIEIALGFTLLRDAASLWELACWRSHGGGC